MQRHEERGVLFFFNFILHASLALVSLTKNYKVDDGSNDDTHENTHTNYTSNIAQLHRQFKWAEKG